MKTAISSTAKDTQNPTKSSPSRFSSPQSSRLAQLAAMMNQSARVQAQLKLRDEIQNSEPVQKQLALAAEINQAPTQTKLDSSRLRLLLPEVVENHSETETIPGEVAQPLMEDEDPAQREAAPTPNRTGLPDQLKSGVENLSGIALDDVKVHYNSVKPAQLNALAYAQGTDIHVAPGQEKHLPHEAWHIVQQKQGRVKPTMQMKGLPLNSDRTLEREASMRRAPALGTAAASLAQQQPFQGVAQRKPVMYKRTDGALDAFVEELDMIVQAAAKRALEDVDTLQGSGYQGLWKDTAAILQAGEPDSKEAEEADAESEADAAAEYEAAARFAPARYGYAVESVACSDARLGSALGGDYTFQLQASRGMTRPDIVVTRNLDNSEVGWFDITSEGGEGHIKWKAGAGWNTKAYVFEITYPTLAPEKIGTGELKIGKKVSIKNVYKRRIAAWKEKIALTVAWFRKEWRAARGDEIRAKKERSEAARSILAKYLGYEEIPADDAKSLLRALGFNIKKFGFKDGGSKGRGETILRGEQSS